MAPEIQSQFTQKVVTEAGPQLDPKLQALQQKVRATLGLPPAGEAKPPAKAGSK